MLVNYLFLALQILILARVLYSWVDNDPYPSNEVKRWLWAVTDPILEPLRRLIPPMGMLDITPIVALVLLSVLRRVVVEALIGY